jgi:hypothetical protein
VTLHSTIPDPASGRTAVPPAVRPLAPVSTDPFELLRALGTERRPSPPDDNELGRRRQRRLLERCAALWPTDDRPA